MINLFSSLLNIDSIRPLSKPILITIHGQSNVNSNSVSANLTELATIDPSLIGIIDSTVQSLKSNNLFSVFNYGNWDDAQQSGDPAWGYQGIFREAAPFHSKMLRMLFDAFQVPIYIVHYGVDNTYLAEIVGVDDWNTNNVGELYDNYTAKIDTAKALMESEFGTMGVDWHYAANLWFQGENDRGPTTNAAYEQNEINLINALRAKYTSSMLFISSQVVDTTYGVVNAAKVANAAKASRNFTFNNDDEVTGDGLHYDTQSHINIGEKFANIILNNSNLFTI